MKGYGGVSSSSSSSVSCPVVASRCQLLLCQSALLFPLRPVGRRPAGGFLLYWYSAFPLPTRKQVLFKRTFLIIATLEFTHKGQITIISCSWKKTEGPWKQPSLKSLNRHDPPPTHTHTGCPSPDLFPSWIPRYQLSWKGGIRRQRWFFSGNGLLAGDCWGKQGGGSACQHTLSSLSPLATSAAKPIDMSQWGGHSWRATG